jgi:hypothetical protein
MRRRIMQISLAVSLALGNSIARGEQQEGPGAIEQAIKYADVAQMFILRFSLVLMALAVVAIWTALMGIERAIRERRT